MSSDAEWEKWGRQDPYFGVVTHDKYRNRNLSASAKAEFFQSGKDHIDHVLDVCRQRIDVNFSPRRSLDFGCGTGRLLIPLAGISETAVGIDVSDSMLREAEKNCNELQLKNVSLVKSDDQLSRLEGQFDFIHSFIVFQHIPVDRGKNIVAALLGHLAENGICAIHFTYAKQAFADNWGWPFANQSGFLAKSLNTVKPASGRLTSLAKRVIGRVFKRNSRSAKDPEMQMNPYRLNDLLFMIQSLGVGDLFVEFVNHDGEFGVYLFFQKLN